MVLLNSTSHAVIQTLPTQFNKKTVYKSHGSYATDLFTGTATYTYPLETCPGRKGLQPSLGLGYSSGGANAALGLGWSFPETMIERDIEYTPADVSDDTFRIQSPGGRFDLVYNPADGQYHTELESYLWIKKQTGGVYGDYWVVKSADGMMMECGNTSDSALLVTTPQGTSFIAKWYIDKITDAYGNSMVYRYDQVAPGQVYLREIAYNNDEARKVSFTRESRPEGSFSNYRDGYEASQSQRVKRVAMQLAGATVRSYELGYTVSAGSGRSLLRSIREMGQDGVTSLPATSFDYVTAQEALGDLLTKKASYAIPNGQQEQPDGTFVVGGDFNGDSFTDVLLYQTQGNSYSWRVMLTGKDGFGDFVTWRDATPVNNSAAAQDAGNFLMAGNFDRDGRSDVLYYDASTLTLKVMLSTGTGFAPFATWNTNFLIPNTTAQKSAGSTIQAGDFNGDGLTDLFLYDASTGNWQVALNMGSSFQPWTMWKTATPLPLTATQRSQGNRMMPGDFNGDGLTDICIYRADDFSYNWQVALSTGKGFTPLATWKTNTPIAVVDSDNQQYGNFVTTGEFNADGMTDILYYDGRPGANDWKVMYSTGSGFKDWVTWRNNLFIDNTPQTLQQGSFLLGGDFSAVGRTEFLVYRHRSDAYDWRVISPQGRDVDLLKTIHEELGGRINIGYTASNQFDNAAADGLPGLPFSRQVVTTVTEDNGMSGPHHAAIVHSYDYQGGLYDFDHREFLGFARVRATDALGNYADTWFHQDTARRGKMYRTEMRASGGALYSKVENTWKSATLAAPAGSRSIVFPYLVKAAEQTFDGNSSCKVMFTENPPDYASGYEYGQPKWTKSYGNMTPLVERRLEYQHDVANWILNKVTRDQTLDAAGLTVAQTWKSYNAQGDPVRQVNWLQGDSTDPANPVTTYEYDAYGNVTRTVSPLGHVTTTDYDSSYHIFPVKVTNALGQAAQSEYDPATGQVTKATDPNGNVTVNQYDALHRLTLTTDAQGGKSTYEYERDGVAPERNTTRRQIKYGVPDTMDAHEYIDGMGRTLQTKSAGTSGRWATVDLTYDERGLTRGFSNRYYTAALNYSAPDTAQPTTLATYDPAERVTRITFPDGTTRQIAYDDWASAYTDENGHMVEAVKDGRGQLLQVIEHNQGENYLTQYRYDTLGHLVGITDAHGNAWALAYDPLGRRTSMNDPDMGLWSYLYDLEGNVTQQTDAKSQVIQFGYDALGRLTNKKTGGAIYVQRSYDQGINGIGRLRREDHWADGKQTGWTELSYDKLGQKVLEVRNIAGNPANLSTAFDFDAMGRTAAMTYPDNEKVNYAYDAQGQLLSMSSAARNYVNSLSYNANNQPVSMVLGNGVQTDYEYAPQMLRLSRMNTTKGSRVLQDFRYFYDAVGNITKIDDTTHTASATYQYDDLNRLVKATGTGTGWSQSFAYNALGNMIQFTDEAGKVHQRAFGVGAGPHALIGELGSALDMVMLNLTGSGLGKVRSSGQLHDLPWSSQVERGKVVDLAGVADPQWAFIGWSGDYAATLNPTTVTMTQAKNITAKFTYRGRGDFDASGGTDLNDFLFLLDHWQRMFDGAIVGSGDFLALLNNWNQSGFKGYSKASQSIAGSTTAVRIDPATGAVGVGDSFVVNVELDTAGWMARGGAVTLLYDPAVFEIMEVSSAVGSPFSLSPKPAWSNGRLEICLLRDDFSLVACKGAVVAVRLKALRPANQALLTYDSAATQVSPEPEKTVRETGAYKIYAQGQNASRNWMGYR